VGNAIATAEFSTGSSTGRNLDADYNGVVPKPPAIVVAPAVLRLSDAELVRLVTGFAPRTIRRLAATEGAPLVVRGEGNGRREFVVVQDFVAWLSASGDRFTAGMPDGEEELDAL
jgi:hypothetical protein